MRTNYNKGYDQDLKFNLDMKYQEILLNLINGTVISSMSEDFYNYYKGLKKASLMLWSRLTPEEQDQSNSKKTLVYDLITKLRREESINGLMFDGLSCKYKMINKKNTLQNGVQFIPNTIFNLRKQIDNELDNWSIILTDCMVRMKLILVSQRTFAEALAEEDL